MEYIHIEIESISSPKISGQLCGDVFEVIRNKEGTTIILVDGLKSGIKANLSATMYLTHLKGLFEKGFSLRESVNRTIEIIEKSKEKEELYSAFIVARILNNGNTAILSYEMPAPLLLSKTRASVLKMDIINNSDSNFTETHLTMSEKDSLLLISDGLSEAGMGDGNLTGWTSEGICDFLNYKLTKELRYKDIPKIIYQRANELSGGKNKDDSTVLLAKARKGTIVNIFSGPPSNPQNDFKQVSEFLNNDGIKIICGATTAKIAASVLNTTLEMEENYDPLLPPSYEIEGIDLVTEGTITLNQLYNLMDEDLSKIHKKNILGDFISLLSAADKILFFVGTTANPANDNIDFIQQGLLKRTKIIPLLADKLREDEKTVIIKYL